MSRTQNITRYNAAEILMLAASILCIVAIAFVL